MNDMQQQNQMLTQEEVNEMNFPNEAADKLDGLQWETWLAGWLNEAELHCSPSVILAWISTYCQAFIIVSYFWRFADYRLRLSLIKNSGSNLVFFIYFLIPDTGLMFLDGMGRMAS